jgi:hypothetical protein
MSKPRLMMAARIFLEIEMKRIVLAFAALAALATAADAGSVNGYFRRDGTYVQPHFRSNPDGYCFNNYGGC